MEDFAKDALQAEHEVTARLYYMPPFSFSDFWQFSCLPVVMFQNTRKSASSFRATVYKTFAHGSRLVIHTQGHPDPVRVEDTYRSIVLQYRSAARPFQGRFIEGTLGGYHQY